MTSKREYELKYKSEKRGQIVINVSKEQRDQINEYCKQFGGTATHIKKLLRDDMCKNGIVPIESGNSLPT